MATKEYIETRTRATNPLLDTEYNARKIMKEQLLPIVKERNMSVVDTDKVLFHFYQRLLSGRRCSCWGIEAGPDSLCTACWGVGLVGGYNKFGCLTEIIDVTSPSTVMVNVIPDYSLQMRPVPFSLLGTATKGYIVTDIPIRKNVGIVESIDTYTGNLEEGNSLIFEIYDQTGVRWLTLNHENLESLLTQNKLTMRITFKRINPEINLPLLNNIYIRYRIREDITIKADVPTYSESKTLAEFGIFESINTISPWLDSTISVVTPEDFMVVKSTDKASNLEEGQRWKVTEVKSNRPSGILISHDLTCRLVQGYDNYTRIP